MKKIIFVIFALLLVSIVSAQNFPFSIWGKVDFFGEVIANHEVKIKAIGLRDNTIAEWKVTTNEKGEYTTDLNSFVDNWARSVVYVEVTGCEGYSECTRRFDITEIDILRVDYIYKESPTQKVVIEGDKVIIYDEKPVYVCSDGSKVVEASLCPKEKPVFVCSDGSTVADESLCPVIVTPPIEPDEKDIYDYLYALGLVILGALGLWGFIKGLVPYYYNKGVEMVKEGKRTGNKDLIAKGEAYKARALKMMITAVKKAQEGKYKK